MISEKQMENYKQLCRDAQNGPWYAIAHEGKYSIEVNAGADIAQNLTKKNAEFIATARTALPRLLAKVQELEKEACWLATNMACERNLGKEICTSCETHGPEDCYYCWREEARKAVSND